MPQFFVSRPWPFLSVQGGMEGGTKSITTVPPRLPWEELKCVIHDFFGTYWKKNTTLFIHFWVRVKTIHQKRPKKMIALLDPNAMNDSKKPLWLWQIPPWGELFATNFIRGCLPYQNKVIERWFSRKVWEWWIWCETQEGWNACRFCALENVAEILRYWFQMIGVIDYMPLIKTCLFVQLEPCVGYNSGIFRPPRFLWAFRLNFAYWNAWASHTCASMGKRMFKHATSECKSFQTEQHYSRWIYWVFAPFFFVYFGFLHPT